MGEITSDKQWQVLSKLKNGYRDSLFTSTAVAQNVAKPLVKYIDNALVGEGASKAKVTLLVGHDSNIASLLTALDFKPYQLRPVRAHAYRRQTAVSALARQRQQPRSDED